jgi:tetratricopeptide (TPR) repeat protein
MVRGDRAVEIERAFPRFVRRHERKLIVAWLCVCALFLGGFAAWGVAFGGAERAADAWERRWIERIDAAELLVEQQKLDAAVAELTELDRDFPGVSIKHRYDKERERILALLGACYVELGRKRLSLDALTRLASFDPKNYDNHFRLAEAQRHFGDTDEARATYEQVLAIHPTHLPTVQARIDMAYAGGLYAPVVEDYERYLDAWLLARVRVSCGERAVELDVPVDGREHALEGALDVPEGWSGSLCVETRGYSAKFGAIELEAPLRAGVVESAEVVKLAPPAELIAEKPGSRTRVDAVSLPRGAARVRLRLTLFKALPKELWREVSKSYANQLETAKWRDAEMRSRVGGCLQAGSLFVED